MSLARRFAIAVSFPGEKRPKVVAIVEALGALMGKDRIFYDEWYEHELVGVDGDLKLRRYYREQSDLIVPFFSKEYEKPWCKVEWSAIRALLLEERSADRVIPVRMDDTKIDGWESTDFAILPKKRTAQQIAELIQKIHATRMDIKTDEKSSGPQTPSSDPSNRTPPATLPKASERSLGEKREQLKKPAAALLENESLRELLINEDLNHIPKRMSARKLTDLLFGISPQLRDAEAASTAMCYLHRCVSTEPKRMAIPPDVAQKLRELASIIAPVCFQVDNTIELEQLASKASDISHASVNAAEPIVGLSVLAAALGKSVDLELRKDLTGAESDQGERRIHATGKLCGTDGIPVLGVEENGIIDAVATRLAPLVEALRSTSEYVSARLHLLAKSGTYVCLWIDRLLTNAALQQLRTNFPQLYILISTSTSDSQLNALVVTQINDIQKTLKEHR